MVIARPRFDPTIACESWFSSVAKTPVAGWPTVRGSLGGNRGGVYLWGNLGLLGSVRDRGVEGSNPFAPTNRSHELAGFPRGFQPFVCLGTLAFRGRIPSRRLPSGCNPRPLPYEATRPP